MPREHVYGAHATVPNGEPIDVGSLLAAYRAFVTDVSGILSSQPSDAGAVGPLRRDLLDRLAALDATLDASVAVAADAPPSGERAVVLRATVGWTRDDGVLTLGVTAIDAATRAEVPLPGSPHVTLDWPAANRLLRVVRTGRDGSCGSPQ